MLIKELPVGVEKSTKQFSCKKKIYINVKYDTGSFLFVMYNKEIRKLATAEIIKTIL